MACFRKFESEKEVRVSLESIGVNITNDDFTRENGASEVVVPFDIGDLPTGEYGMVEDLEQASLPDDNQGFSIPTTNGVVTPMEYTGNFGFMGASVLLNKCGTMLIRRQTQLQASK